MMLIVLCFFCTLQPTEVATSTMVDANTCARRYLMDIMSASVRKDSSWAPMAKVVNVSTAWGVHPVISFRQFRGEWLVESNQFWVCV
jgi:hypothetical protein